MRDPQHANGATIVGTALYRLEAAFGGDQISPEVMAGDVLDVAASCLNGDDVPQALVAKATETAKAVNRTGVSFWAERTELEALIIAAKAPLKAKADSTKSGK